ncbi:60S ribosome subunit biogenesis NIP7 [Babesia ovata]|uniref:60S ribosome subunit biogenesis NIP7 n=1 Tax=Babesia ovata TaxID=189622 RepID=A0A2H6KFN0_9APIC|nr:60S ribosome subunit biogenesis NIP7 [Babesia ovata]GBE61802.1 60S ribosome subunit biogenesis NIP7 [Babesia ovata]
MRPLSEDEAQLHRRKGPLFGGRRRLGAAARPTSASRKGVLHEYSGCINHKNLISAGVCLGKFTKAKHFRLHITALHYMAHYSKSKVWLKSGEQSFVYGNNVAKKHIGQMSEDVPQNGGVVVMYNNLPLGFGVTSKSTEALKTTLPDDVAVFHQADIGEYLRHEAEII